MPETTLDCPQRSLFLAYLTNRYLLPKNYIQANRGQKEGAV